MDEEGGIIFMEPGKTVIAKTSLGTINIGDKLLVANIIDDRVCLKRLEDNKTFYVRKSNWHKFTEIGTHDTSTISTNHARASSSGKDRRFRYQAYVRELNEDGRYGCVSLTIDFMKNVHNFDFRRLNYSERKQFGAIRHLALFQGNRDAHGKPCAIVGFPGSRDILSQIETPQLSQYLPSIFEFWLFCSMNDKNAPLYILGEAFDDLRRRKFDLLSEFINHVIVIPTVNVTRGINKKTHFKLEIRSLPINEQRLEYELIQSHLRIGELADLQLSILQNQVPANKGTKLEEEIDILAVDPEKALAVIELKFIERKNSHSLKSAFFQALDYLRWVEENKRMLQLIYGKDRINTRKRARLILANISGFPEIVRELSEHSKSLDKYLKIDFFKIYLDEHEQLKAHSFSWQ